MGAMEVLSVIPFGYCSGVEKAMSVAINAKRENPDRNVCLLGSLIHNETAIAYLKSQGLILLDESLINLEKALKDLEKGDVVVFSAHGHPRYYDDVAKEKGLLVYDATCRFVNENLSSSVGKSPLIYIGQEGHLEKEAFLANCPSAYFYSVSNGEGSWRECEKHPSIIAQTTLSGEEISKALEEIESQLGQAEFIKGRCLATSLRQKAMEEGAKNADCAIVLGSATSNNSKKLFEIAAKHCPAFLCLGLDEVKRLDLSRFKKVALSSGTSTSRETFLEVRSYLQTL